jgi:hypothetical protein
MVDPECPFLVEALDSKKALFMDGIVGGGGGGVRRHKNWLCSSTSVSPTSYILLILSLGLPLWSQG